jgi:sirohydrochlorin cobaltochelatase
MRGILFFCHGARLDSWRQPFEAILAQSLRERPEIPAALAFLEMMQPDLFDAVAQLHAQGALTVDVIPLFLAPGSHTQRDLPQLLDDARQRWPELTFRVAPTLTESPAVREAIVQAAFANVPK